MTTNDTLRTKAQEMSRRMLLAGWSPPTIAGVAGLSVNSITASEFGRGVAATTVDLLYFAEGSLAEHGWRQNVGDRWVPRPVAAEWVAALRARTSVTLLHDMFAVTRSSQHRILELGPAPVSPHTARLLVAALDKLDVFVSVGGYDHDPLPGGMPAYGQRGQEMLKGR
jgi:hypothetical protein